MESILTQRWIKHVKSVDNKPLRDRWVKGGRSCRGWRAWRAWLQFRARYVCQEVEAALAHRELPFPLTLQPRKHVHINLRHFYPWVVFRPPCAMVEGGEGGRSQTSQLVESGALVMYENQCEKQTRRNAQHCAEKEIVELPRGRGAHSVLLAPGFACGRVSSPCGPCFESHAFGRSGGDGDGPLREVGDGELPPVRSWVSWRRRRGRDGSSSRALGRLDNR